MKRKVGFLTWLTIKGLLSILIWFMSLKDTQALFRHCLHTYISLQCEFFHMFKGNWMKSRIFHIAMCKGLLSSVSSFMFFEVTGRTKGFSILLAYIGFLTTVRYFIFSKVTG
jgi:hypothetical protein